MTDENRIDVCPNLSERWSVSTVVFHGFQKNFFVVMSVVRCGASLSRALGRVDSIDQYEREIVAMKLPLMCVSDL